MTRSETKKARTDTEISDVDIDGKYYPKQNISLTAYGSAIKIDTAKGRHKQKNTKV